MRSRALWLIASSFIVAMLISGFLFAEGLVNVNTASIEELKTLQGVGDARAEAIIKYREKNGPFESLDDLRKVNGIGHRIIEANRSKITLQQDTAGTKMSDDKSDNASVKYEH